MSMSDPIADAYAHPQRPAGPEGFGVDAFVR